MAHVLSYFSVLEDKPIWPIYIRVTSLRMGSSYDCPCPSETNMNMLKQNALSPKIMMTLPLQSKAPKTVHTVYPKKYAHGFVVLCFVVVMQSFIMNSHELFIHIHQGCFAGTGAIVRLPQCQWSKPDGYGKISQCITTAKQKPCAYFLGYTVYIFHGINWEIQAPEKQVFPKISYDIYMGQIGLFIFSHLTSNMYIYK